MKRDYGVFHVGLKILLEKDGKFLFLRADNKINWDWPGGRIDNVETMADLESVIKREIGEELGKEVKYKLGKPIFQFIRYFRSRDIYIFITLYEAKYISGEIKLSHEHFSYEWLDPKKDKLNKKDFFNLEEYFRFRSYFKGL